jgi:hypothetical protein
LSGCEQKLQQFVQDYSTKASSVHEATQQACQSVQESYDTLMSTAQGKLQANPFDSLGTTPDFDSAGGNGHTGGHSGGGGGGGGGPTGGGGGSGSVPVGGGGGTTPPQAVAPPPDPSHPGDGATPPAGQPETVEIKDGDRTISVTSPDGQGHVKVSVDDGSGKPKSYDLDFGTGSSGTGSSGAGTPSADGANVPVGSGQSGTGQSGTGQPGTGQPGTGQPGTGQPPGGADTPVHAGADGKCVIHDGPLTITAEHPPGNPDTVKVTIDDGSGKPTTYTLDYSDQPGTGAAGSGVRPVPGSADGPAPPTAPGQAGAHDPGSATPLVAHAEPSRDPGTPLVASAGMTTGDPAAGSPLVASADPASSDAAQATVAQASATPGGGYSPGNFSDVGGAVGSVGAHDIGYEAGGDHHGASGEAGISTSTDDGSGGNQSDQPQPAGGGMPMGGMGAGAGGGAGGDQDRSGSTWRAVGDLFDEDYPDAEAALGRVTSDDRR